MVFDGRAWGLVILQRENLAVGGGSRSLMCVLHGLMLDHTWCLEM